MNSVSDKSKNYINRELSWLEFNSRVLEEAQDISNPLFERLKFLSIVSSNLDEFFMVRVASLKDLVEAGSDKTDPAGLTPVQQIIKISARSHLLVEDQYNTYNRSLRQALKKEGINIIKPKSITNTQRKYVDNYYLTNVFPVLTPMVVDKSRPFPLILNKSLNLSVRLQDKNNKSNEFFATVQVPSVLSRLVELPSENDTLQFMLLEDIIKLHLSSLFNGHNIIASSFYRITRNADLSLDEEGAEDLLETIELSIRQRKWSSPVRLEIEKNADPFILSVLRDELEISEESEYEIQGPIDLTFLMKFGSILNSPEFKYPQLVPVNPEGLTLSDDIFSTISSSDIMLHHPYNSFDAVVNLVKQASEDPYVLAIKQTLYRVSGKSPIVEHLARAAENGKQVTVLVELKARFDEENNIIWAKRLEQAGCHVIYGLVGLKTHCKVLLIVRKEETGIKRYVHMSTGNYNDVTAKLYTDIGIMTANPYFGADASALFNMLSGHSYLNSLNKMIIAPDNMREKFIALIKKETEYALSGKKAKIIAKLNSLVDKEIIDTLYEASSAGVVIDLIIRGICCLKPGIQGVSKNITVRSIVGRFLEHSRIYYFYNDSDPLIYMSSADWMNRNLDRRVELLFPIEDKNIHRELFELLHMYLQDTAKARMLNFDGSYSRIDRRGKDPVNSQELAYLKMKKKLSSNDETQSGHSGFKPLFPTVSAIE